MSMESSWHSEGERVILWMMDDGGDEAALRLDRGAVVTVR
jgi:hypothetical protein